MTARCSVVIPCRNYARFLDAAIGSVLGQRHVIVEVIVVDDGSTDETAAVAQAHRGVRLIRQPHRGVAAARNAGLRAADGEWIVFLDADDMLLPHAVEVGVGHLAGDSHAAVAAGRALIVDGDGTEMPAHWSPPVTSGHYGRLLSTNLIWTPGAAVMRRSAVLAAGGFLADRPAAADYALYLRLARTASFVCHDREVVMYRQHGDNMSRDSVEMLRATLAVLKAERPFVPEDLTAEFRCGVRAWRDYHGDRIAEDLRSAIHEPHGLARSARRAAALLRYHPRGFLRQLGRKLAVATGFRPAERSPHRKSRARPGETPARSEDGRRTEPTPAPR
jgi:hypothetical protein